MTCNQMNSFTYSKCTILSLLLLSASLGIGSILALQERIPAHNQRRLSNADDRYGNVGYQKRDISKHSSGTSLSANKVPLAGPVSYWRASRQESNGAPQLEATALSDVLFYLAFAITWLVWLMKSFVKSDWLRFTQDSLLVRGNVLQVTVNDMDVGVPTYTAVIDYFVGEDKSQIQIRKEFTTQTFLEQGFGNVELLVLADEPTLSVLKNDWQTQLEEMEEERVHPSFLANKLWKRAWVVILGTMVLASLAGSVISARFLPTGRTRIVGCILVCITIVCLFHIALWLRMALTKMERYFLVRNGVILREGGQWGDNSSAVERALSSASTGCDPFDVLDANACDDMGQFSLANDRQRQIEMSSTMNLEESAGCYVIQMNPQNDMGRNASMVSDVSSNSGRSRNGSKPNEGGPAGLWNVSGPSSRKDLCFVRSKSFG